MKPDRSVIKELETRIYNFSRAIILVSMNEDDEAATRVEIQNNYNQYREKYREPLDKKALDDGLSRFYKMDFNELKEFYYSCLNGKGDEIMEQIKNGEIYTAFFTNKKSEPMVLYSGGLIGKNFQKIKSFKFEDELYVLLKDLDNGKQGYYKYFKDENENEKLLVVDDAQLISVFDFLDL